MTTYCIGSDRSGSVTRVTKSYTWTAALYWRRRLRHMAFPVISLSLSLYLYIYISFIYSTRIYLCMYVCMFETSPSERMDRFEKSFFCQYGLGQGKVLGRKKYGFWIKFSQKTGKTSILHSKFPDFFTVNFVEFSSRTRQLYFHVRFIRIYSLRLNLPIFTIIGRSPETSDSGKAARGQRRSGQYIYIYIYV